MEQAPNNQQRLITGIAGVQGPREAVGVRFHQRLDPPERTIGQIHIVQQNGRVVQIVRQRMTVVQVD